MELSWQAYLSHYLSYQQATEAGYIVCYNRVTVRWARGANQVTTADLDSVPHSAAGRQFVGPLVLYRETMHTGEIPKG